MLLNLKKKLSVVLFQLYIIQIIHQTHTGSVLTFFLQTAKSSPTLYAKMGEVMPNSKEIEMEPQKEYRQCNLSFAIPLYRIWSIVRKSSSKEPFCFHFSLLISVYVLDRKKFGILLTM